MPLLRDEECSSCGPQGVKKVLVTVKRMAKAVRRTPKRMRRKENDALEGKLFPRENAAPVGEASEEKGLRDG